MAASGNFSSDANSLRSRALIVSLALRPCGFARRDDADDFLAIVFLICMSDQQDRYRSDQSNCLPPLFAIFMAILDAEMVRVFKRPARQFEADAVLLPVGSILSRIPGKSHL